MRNIFATFATEATRLDAIQAFRDAFDEQQRCVWLDWDDFVFLIVVVGESGEVVEREGTRGIQMFADASY